MASHDTDEWKRHSREQLLKNKDKLKKEDAHTAYGSIGQEWTFGNTMKYFTTHCSLICDGIYDWISHLSQNERIKKVTATIFNPVQLRVVEEMLPEFTSKLQRLLRSRHGVELTIEPSGPAASKPLLVMCVNASRLGTDVDNALQHVTCTQESMVVVLHYKDKHALPSQSSDKLLIGPSYQALGGISDIAFTSENGLYNCEMNERGIEKIADFIIQRNLY